jgi:hypothetical protein
MDQMGCGKKKVPLRAETQEPASHSTRRHYPQAPSAASSYLEPSHQRASQIRTGFISFHHKNRSVFINIVIHTCIIEANNGLR